MTYVREALEARNTVAGGGVIEVDATLGGRDSAEAQREWAQMLGGWAGALSLRESAGSEVEIYGPNIDTKSAIGIVQQKVSEAIVYKRMSEFADVTTDDSGTFMTWAFDMGQFDFSDDVREIVTWAHNLGTRTAEIDQAEAQENLMERGTWTLALIGVGLTQALADIYTENVHDDPANVRNNIRNDASALFQLQMTNQDHFEYVKQHIDAHEVDTAEQLEEKFERFKDLFLVTRDDEGRVTHVGWNNAGDFIDAPGPGCPMAHAQKGELFKQVWDRAYPALWTIIADPRIARSLEN